MAAEVSVPRSRRAVILAGLAALVGATAELATRPALALANDPNDVVKGVVNHTTNATSITNDAERGTAFEAHADLTGMIVTAGSDTGVGISVSGTTAIVADGEVGIVASGLFQGIVVSGRVAVTGGGEDVGVMGDGAVGVQGSGGVGVQGSGVDAGVLGESSVGHAVRGVGSAPNQPAVLGWSTSQQSGVQGYSADSAHQPGPPPARTGVYGYAAQNGSARGVYGQSTVGRGVEGHATSGLGVVASATTGTALEVTAASAGWALRTTSGRVGFSTSGLATIAAGKSSVTVTPGFDISSTSKVLAVLQGDPGSAAVLHHVSRDTVSERFTIHLTANTISATPVAWFVIS